MMWAEHQTCLGLAHSTFPWQRSVSRWRWRPGKSRKCSCWSCCLCRGSCLAHCCVMHSPRSGAAEGGNSNQRGSIWTGRAQECRFLPCTNAGNSDNGNRAALSIFWLFTESWVWDPVFRACRLRNRKLSPAQCSRSQIDAAHWWMGESTWLTASGMREQTKVIWRLGFTPCIWTQRISKS